MTTSAVGLAGTVAASLEGPVASVLARYGIPTEDRVVLELVRTTAVVMLTELSAREAEAVAAIPRDELISSRDRHIQAALVYQDAAGELRAGLPGASERWP